MRQSTLVVCAVLLCVSTALAAPTKLVQQGRLLADDGGPLEGTHALQFTLFDAASDGTAVWTEDHFAAFESGYYSVELGSQALLDELLFDNGTLWLELVVAGATLSPRQEILPVPYALRAAAAERLEGGSVDAQEISVDGSVVIDSSGNWVGPSPNVSWTTVTDVPADLADGDQDTITTTLEWSAITGVPTDFGLQGEPGDPGPQGEQGDAGETCSVSSVEDGLATLSCPDGSFVEWPTTVSVTSGMPFSLPEFEIPGTPPPAAIAPHLLMPNDQLVIVDYPENLTSAGLNHREVIEAAIAMFPQYQGQPQTHGFWEKGEVRFQIGSYIIDQEIDWPARLNLIGASRYVRNGGTRFWASAGMTKDDYIFRLLSGDHGDNVNGNFFQHLRNVHFNGNNFSSGVAWGGAQSSSMKNVEIQGIPQGGTCVLIQTGTNAMIVEAVWCDGESQPDTTGFRGGPIIEGGVTFIACKAESIAVGFDLERGDHYAVGAYFENIGIPVIRRGNTGNTRFMGLSVKNISGVGTNGLPLIFDLPDGLANFYASGIVRESSQAVGYERSGVFYELIAESLFVLPGGQPNTAQRGYEVNVLEHVRNIPLELDGDTELSIGRRYFEDFGGGSAHSVAFVGPEEEGKRVELRTESTGSVTLAMPESVIAGSDALMDEVTLDAGYHVLIWERIGGQWWLRVD